MKYIWYHNDDVLANATNSSTLTLNNVTANDSGSYYCQAIVTFNNGGTLPAVNSTLVTLNITEPNTISITQDLKNLSIINGQTATLTVAGAIDGKTDNLAYKWEYLAPNGNNQWQKITKGGNAASLSLNKEQAFNANGYQFRCVLSCTDPIQQVAPKTSKPMTLRVVNPSFSVQSKMTPASGLKFGENVTLSASAVTNSSDIPSGNTFEIQYAYQWYSSNDQGKTWNEVSNGNKQEITLTNLTSVNQNQKYMCVAYPSTAVVSTPSESIKKTKATDNSSIPGTNPYRQESNVLTLNIAPFNVKVSAFVGTSQNPTSGTSLTNNLGDKINLNATLAVQSPYNALPEGYQYTYQWQISTSIDSSASWQSIDLEQTSDANKVNRDNVISNQAGQHYYRCVVKIAKVAPSGLLKTAEQSSEFISEPVSVNTYPQLKITDTNSSVTLAHNASTTLSPTITVINNLETKTGEKVQPKSGLMTLDNSIAQYDPVYQWSYKPTNGSEQPITEGSLNKFPFITDDSYKTGSLNINSVYAPKGCSGQFNLTVSINNKPYSLQTPYTVTESDATFTVTSKAVAQVNASTVTLSASATPVKQEPADPEVSSPKPEDPKSRVARNADVLNKDSVVQPSYTYTWYSVVDGQNPVKLDPKGGANNSTQTLWLPDGKTVQQAWANKWKFYCEVTNNETHEVEYNTQPVGLTIENPTLSEFNIQGNTTNLPYHTSLNLSAETNPSFTVNGKPVSYQWQYYSNSESKWVNINANDPNVTISQTGNKTTLQITDAEANWNNMKIQCVASYGNDVTKTSNQVTVTVQSKELVSANSTTLAKFANTISTAFSSNNLAHTLENDFGMRTTYPSPTGGLNLETADSWINEILGKSLSSGDLNVIFGSTSVEVYASVVPVKSTLATEGKDVSPQVPEESNGQVTAGQPGTVNLEISFTTRSGYTWPTSLTSKSNSGYTASLSNSNQTLTVTVPTALKPSFSITKTSNDPIQISSTQNTITATVKSSSAVNTFEWWAVPANGDPIELTAGSEAVTQLFGSNAKLEINIQTQSNTSTLTISNVQSSESLNGLKIYGSGIINKVGSFWQQWSSLPPFTIQVQSETSSVPGTSEHQANDKVNPIVKPEVQANPKH